MNANRHLAFPLAAMTAALLGVYGPAFAEEDEEVAWLTRPTSTVSVGVGHLSDDAARFGQYSGLRKEGAYGLVDIDIVRRDDDTGTWFRVKGRNLGLSSREFRLSHERQGEWGYFIDYSAIPRHEPWTVQTGVTGIGTDTLNIPATTPGVVVPLKTEREVFGIGFNRRLGNGFDLSLTARNDEKDGARIFARGQTFQFAPEPINSSTRQWEAQLGYTAEKLQLSLGYHGSSYDNAYNLLSFTGVGGASNFNQYLPPDNQAHQFSLGGGYSFTPTTRMHFKLAYGKATQNDQFATLVGINPALAGMTNLDGSVETKQASWGISARPLDKLTLLANLRYEDRDDKTPIRQYITGAAATATHIGSNEPRSFSTISGKLEAGYALPYALRLTGGVDYTEKDRKLPDPLALRDNGNGLVTPVTFRRKTDETTYRLDLRRSMSETVTGTIGYAKSDRGGSPFLVNRLNNGTLGSNHIAPLHLADRDREKIRLAVNWEPIESLSVQFDADRTRDQYTQDRSASALGLRDGTSKNFAIDVAYTINDEWTVNGWLSKNDADANMAGCNVGAGPAFACTAANTWLARLVNDGRSAGLGLRGQPMEKLAVGADLSYSKYFDSYGQARLDGTIPGTVVPLPDVTTRRTTLSLFATYSLRKNADLRFNYIYDRFATNDWTWSGWTYSDGTTIYQNQRQRAQFFGVSYVYRYK